MVSFYLRLWMALAFAFFAGVSHMAIGYFGTPVLAVLAVTTALLVAPTPGRMVAR